MNILETAHCFRCNAQATEWFDGPGDGTMQASRRAICKRCEYVDWKATAHAYNSGQAI